MYIYQASSASSVNSAATSGWVQLLRRWTNVGFEVNLAATGSPIGTFIFEVTNDDNPNVPQGVILGAVPLTLTPPQSTTFQPTDGFARNVTFMFNPAPSAKWIRMRYAAGSGGTSAGLNVGITQWSAGTSLAPFIPYNSNLTLPPPPGSPLWWLDPRSFDGQLNATMTDTQQIGTWVNLGSLGASGNAIQATAGLRPTFKLLGSAGKLNNTPTMLITPTQWMQTANVAIQAQANLICFVGLTAGGGTRTFVDGNDAVNRNDTFATGTWEQFAGTALNDSTIAATTNVYHVVCSLFSGTSSTIRVNKTTSTPGTSPGGASLDGLSIGVGGDATSPCSGQIGAILVYGAGTAPAQGLIDAWYDAAFGSSWPQ